MEDRKIKQVIVVRKDLNMRKGKIAAQAAHASMKVLLDRMSCSNDYGKMNLKLTMDFNGPLYNWIFAKFTKIVVYVNSEVELLTLRDECLFHELPCALIKDSGLTEFKGVKTYTCLAIGPEKNDKIDIITEDLPLL